MEFLLLIFIFQIKHFVADYLLQGSYMLGKFNLKGWEIPLLAHSSVHMAMTFGIVLCYLPLPYAIGLAIMDISLHFCIDRIKVVASRGYDSNTDKEFWWLLGLDQMAHHYTH